ncbi:unnamed protein product [Caenorhabditis auriculariae]|uniref:Uncharacterized protein n=1 Tax=Caenorhabditis auriculariae TaxID=2777116 RepID=A0A8S1H041_9PELO|nr:unnamed protein product [Caenorhabditis auriculariae]
MILPLDRLSLVSGKLLKEVLVISKELEDRLYLWDPCYFHVPLAFSFVIIPQASEPSLLSSFTSKMEKAFNFFASHPLNRFSHEWICRRVFLEVNGTLEFKVSNMRNKHSYFGLDQIALIDPTTGTGACVN